MTKKDDDLKNTDLDDQENPEKKGEDLTDEDKGLDQENLSDEEKQSKQDNDTDVDENAKTVPMEVYKGLQRTVNERNEEIKRLKGENQSLNQEIEDLKESMEKGDIVRADLQKSIRETNERIEALETENQQAKKEAMKNRVLMEKFPDLQHLKEYIPDADTEEDFVENASAFKEKLGKQVDSEVTRELEGSTPPVDGDDNGVPSQEEVDQLYDKAMSLAGLSGKQEEYDAAYDKYLAALNARNQT